MKVWAVRMVVSLVIALGIAAAALAIGAWHSPIPSIAPPLPGAFDQLAIRRGAQLAALGNCITCHTAEGGALFAGGRPIPTPFGTIYSSNITPDPQAGIGGWSGAAFHRAMREGVDRAGRQLYPAFPYDHFTLVNDADDTALYAYFMTRQPSHSRPPRNALAFPFSMRWLMSGWKLLFFRTGPYRPDPSRDAQWNRGAYLVNGLAHCGACHTPRNLLGAERRSAQLSGGETQGWQAYAINSASPARVHWDAAAVRSYLRNGWQSLHGDAHGPMADVAENLSAASPSDVDAIATYVAWTMGRGSAAQIPLAREVEDDQAEGAAIFRGACGGCHDGARPLPLGGVKLSLSTAVLSDQPLNLINVILGGLYPPAGATGAIMPGFAGSLSDEQLGSLIAYVRLRYGGEPPWKDIRTSVRAARARLK